MLLNKKITTVIVDDNQECIFGLEEHLATLPEIELLASASNYRQAKNAIIANKPDLVFLDIEMPVKNGFELLQEIRDSGKASFEVIFHTAFDKYLIDALRQSALDYILKPVKREDLVEVIERFKTKERKRLNELIIPTASGIPEMISLPVSTGMRFVDKKNIVLVQCVKDGMLKKSIWEVLFNDGTKLKLRSNLNAGQLELLLGTDRCVCINQSTLVNLHYLSLVEFKTRECFLVPPYDTIQLFVSRNKLAELRAKFPG